MRPNHDVNAASMASKRVRVEIVKRSLVLVGGVLVLAGCGAGTSQSGPLDIGIPEEAEPDSSLCIPGERLDEQPIVADLAMNPTDEPAVITGISLVDAVNVAPLDAGAIDLPAGGLMTTYEDGSSPPSVPYPDFSPEPLRYELEAGKTAQVMLKIEPAGPHREASIQRLRIDYEWGNRLYSEVTNQRYEFVPGGC